MDIVKTIKGNLMKFVPKSMRKGHALGRRYGHSRKRKSRR